MTGAAAGAGGVGLIRARMGAALGPPPTFLLPQLAAGIRLSSKRRTVSTLSETAPRPSARVSAGVLQETASICEPGACG